MTFEATDQSRLRINTTDTRSNGATTLREEINFNRIFDQTNQPIISVPKPLWGNEMMKSYKKQLQIFMIQEDEGNFSILLKNIFENVAFLDENVWLEKPNNENSIEDCQTGYCYIWNKDITPVIPTITRNDGKIQGLVIYSGEILEVKEAFVEYLDKPIKVYNFEVED